MTQGRTDFTSSMPDRGFGARTGASASSGSMLRVLVVEDDPVQALLMKLFLDRMGVASMHVSDGAQGFEAVKRHDFAMVLMDCVMPALNGPDTTRAIRQWEETTDRPRLPIIAVTASAMRDECEGYLEAGMDAVLLKPFSAQQLRTLLYRYLPLGQAARSFPGG